MFELRTCFILFMVSIVLGKELLNQLPGNRKVLEIMSKLELTSCDFFNPEGDTQAKLGEKNISTFIISTF